MMETTLDCLPCFAKQILHTVRLCTEDSSLQKEILHRAFELLIHFDFSKSPPENAVAVYRLIADLAGCNDPFQSRKEESNTLALALRPHARDKMYSSSDPLYTACRFAAAANIIDYGSRQDFDVERTLSECLEQPFIIDDFNLLAGDIVRAGNILYLADNCGELVFDSLVVEYLAQQGKEVTVAVKEEPIINDATMHDAAICGLEKYCSVISNGTACPGTPLNDCSASFRKAFDCADLIISKGQGNFETLSEAAGPVYFLLTVKCAVVGRHLAEVAGLAEGLAGEGEMVLSGNR